MPDENPTSFGLTNSRSINRLRETATETIDLDSLFTSEVTSTGSFDIRGGIWATTFGKVMQVLPIPALLIDGSYNVAVCNQACRKISQDYEKIHGQPFADLFPNRSDSENALSVIKAVFTSRKPRVLESALEIEGSTMWGRMTIRPIRIAQQRLVLTLIEDLTLEKKQRLHDEKLREDLEKLVKERTAELELIAEQLRKEIDRRKRIAEELRKNEASYEALLNATRDLAFLLGSDGTLLAANEQVAKHFRLPSGDLLGRSLFDLAPAGLAGVEETRFNEIIRSANPLRYEAEFFGKVYDNNFYPILDLEGAVIAVAAYIRDITAEKKTNELLMQSARIKAVGDMASGVAHNFNNLLQIVMNAAYDVLADLESNNVSESKAKIKRIIKSASGGAGTVRRLQDFARARTRRTRGSGQGV